MESYTYGASQTVLEEARKLKTVTTFGMLDYQIKQARILYPNMIIKEVKYERIKDGVEDPIGTKVDEHKWTIILVTMDEFFK